MHEIQDYALRKNSGLKAADIRIGLGYTVVLLEDGRCGLAYTLHEKEFESCCVFPDAGKLIGRNVSDLISYVKSEDVISCAVGLATVNAVLDLPAGVFESDILDVLPAHEGDTVGMVGYFGPLVKNFKERVQALHIFERKPDPGNGILPESEAVKLLPECQVVVMTATTLLNNTIDRLLNLCGNAREIAILGPSTPFAPEVFRSRGVTMLSGLQVVDAGKILQIVSQGGGTRQFGNAARKLSFHMPATQ